MDKDVIKSLIALRQSEIPFEVFPRDSELPLDRGKIITVRKVVHDDDCNQYAGGKAGH